MLKTFCLCIYPFINLSIIVKHRYLIQLAYDGTDYVGWQIQPNGMSVQEKLQETRTELDSMAVELRTAQKQAETMRLAAEQVQVLQKKVVALEEELVNSESLQAEQKAELTEFEASTSTLVSLMEEVIYL